MSPERWVDEYSDVLFRFAYIRTGDRDTAEDLAQETFVAALQGYHQFQGRSSLQTWLISILRNKISEHFRLSRRQPVNSSEIDSEGQDFFENGKWKESPLRWTAKAEDEVNRKEFGSVLSGCMGHLTPALADAFILCEMELMDTEEICCQLKISSTGLWSRLHRARLNLRHCLEINWFS